MKYSNIIFDLDSTLVTIEGLDWIAKRKGVFDKVSEMTKLSMDGTMKIEDIVVEKLNLIAPNREDLELLGKEYVRNLTLNTKNVIKYLKSKGCEIWIMTGNYEIVANYIANELEISKDNLFFNSINISSNGEFIGIEAENVLNFSDGKKQLMKKHKKKFNGSSVFIGDSMSDLEAGREANLFIGFGGNIERQKVKELSTVYISESNMELILPHILEDEELREYMKSK